MLLGLLGLLAAGGGCTSSDSVRLAQRALDRALELESPAAFYEPVLARTLGAPAPPPPSPRARQYYLTAIAEMEVLGPIGKENLKRRGLLGNALAVKLLAQWRLDRVDDAQASLTELRASGQEALSLRDRTLVAAFSGVLQLNRAIAALEARESYDEIHRLILGEDGAWRTLGAARMEANRTGTPTPELLQARLAAFKVLYDAHARLPVVPTPANVVDNEWLRARSAAQIELNQLAALPTTNAATVDRWREACGLEPPRAAPTEPAA